MNPLTELAQQAEQRLPEQALPSREVLARLRKHPPGPMHIIDPFKVPVAEAVEKTRALTRLGFPAIILASTDYEAFETRMEPYVARVKAATPLPVLLHFPPRRGTGFPLVAGADAVVLPALLGSRDDYYVWKSYLETLLTLPGRMDREHWPEFLLTVALTFGEDSRTGDLLGTVPVSPALEELDQHIAITRSFGFHMVYLYSRNSHVPPEVVRYFRDRLHPDQILFVSGNVRSAERIAVCLEAGADYVGFAGALEQPDWLPVLERMAATYSTDGPGTER
ncbi:geranylgeranylglyceryl/heptaprenylglyceryl phosphate synthase [Streptomyces sp. AK02-01A]|uniref:geranylgeranylglyceryl/heptaprenylglyceryl phosphate synthase n=1 Tax=Streptomyces sp. AK02-01A TaxID=3028648 RepID=UPI0029BE23B8|nr:geranylgeranylglyceryl/heptaprenylglyceryl phosphate synthase [Streptomyces sp. AK02-01A]MDX3852347.1 geranylgeranylglyceryl/heptaprenylglyceryl phosphate synthase [Streptomyces sp. AK02-01A]